MDRIEDRPDIAHAMTKRNLIFAVVTLAAIGLNFNSLKSLARFAAETSLYQYSFAIPVISLFLLALERQRVFRSVNYGYGMGLLLMSVAFAIRWWAGHYASDQTSLTFAALSFLVMLAGVFTLSYGLKSLRAAGFLFSLLLFAVP